MIKEWLRNKKKKEKDEEQFIQLSYLVKETKIIFIFPRGAAAAPTPQKPAPLVTSSTHHQLMI